MDISSQMLIYDGLAPHASTACGPGRWSITLYTHGATLHATPEQLNQLEQWGFACKLQYPWPQNNPAASPPSNGLHGQGVDPPAEASDSDSTDAGIVDPREEMQCNDPWVFY